jgi:dUTP pyrophosphatase
MTRPVVKLKRVDGSDMSVALPEYESKDAAGADLRANLPMGERDAGVVLLPGHRALIPTGLAMEIEPGYEVQVRPRSGLALKHGVTVLNAPGTIDADYRGQVSVILINHGDTNYAIAHGERIAQMIVAPAMQANLQETDALGDTARGAGGFGSTGQG